MRENGPWLVPSRALGISSRDLFKRESRNFRPLARVLDGYPANVSLPIQIENRILIQVPRLGNVRGLELDVKAVGLWKVFDLHGLNLRSKKAGEPFHHLAAI